MSWFSPGVLWTIYLLRSKSLRTHWLSCCLYFPCSDCSAHIYCSCKNLDFKFGFQNNSEKWNSHLNIWILVMATTSTSIQFVIEPRFQSLDFKYNDQKQIQGLDFVGDCQYFGCARWYCWYYALQIPYAKAPQCSYSVGLLDSTNRSPTV